MFYLPVIRVTFKRRYEMNLIHYFKKKKAAIIFVVYLRYLVGGAMVFSSIVKIKGERFTSTDGIAAPVNSAWHFFETLYQSGVYWKFLGWSQLLTGLLLMTQLYAALGAVLLFPITLNILMITLSYYFAGTPVITGLLVLANILLILWDYQKLLPLFQIYSRPQPNAFLSSRAIEHDRIWSYLGVLLFLFTVVYVPLFERNPIPWFLTCIILGVGGFLIFHRRKT